MDANETAHDQRVTPVVSREGAGVIPESPQCRDVASATLVTASTLHREPAGAQRCYAPPLKLEHFTKTGIWPLPEDLAFINARFPVDIEGQQKAFRCYTQAWLAAMDAEELEHKKQNAGRRAANLAVLRGDCG